MAFNKLTFFLTEKENKIINFKNQKVNQNLNSSIFVGVIPINNEPTKIAAIFDAGDVDNVAAELIVRESCDIAIIVNLNSSSVSFRKKQKCKVDLEKLAKKLCNGQGTKKSSEGKITDTFLNFTKLLSEK
jgi:hypothetical protein